MNEREADISTFRGYPPPGVTCSPLESHLQLPQGLSAVISAPPESSSVKSDQGEGVDISTCRGYLPLCCPPIITVR